MRYRIKITTFKSGRQEFKAQKKVLLGWSDLGYSGVVYHLTNLSPSGTRSEALNIIDKNYEGNATKQTIEFEYITR